MYRRQTAVYTAYALQYLGNKDVGIKSNATVPPKYSTMLHAKYDRNSVTDLSYEAVYSSLFKFERERVRT